MPTDGELRAPLRCVILCDSLQFERWQAECIRRTIGSGHTQVVGLVMRDAPPPPASASKWKKRWKARKLALWRVYDRYYLRRFSKAVVREDLSDLLGAVPAVTDQPALIGRFGEALSAEAMAFIHEQRPDFVLRFSYGILRGEVLNAARYGLWSFHHGDPARFRGQPPGFWEIHNGSATTGAILQVLGEELDAGRILHRGFFKTLPQSYAKSRDQLYLGVASWVARTCADIRLNGWLEQPAAKAEAKGPILRQPANGAMLRFLWITLVAAVRTQLRYKLFRQTWNCGVVAAPIEVVAGLNGPEAQRSALRDVVWMQPGRGEFYADPFGMRTEQPGKVRLLFERYHWPKQRGDIASVTFDGERFGPVTDCLTLDTHLSYPFVLEREGSKLMLPENAEGKAVRSYTVAPNGTAQELAVIAADAEWIDTTIIEHDNLLWAFSVREESAANTHLYLHYADSLDGPWQPHPLNPVKSDVASARPAGTPFRHEGRLYRPAQDCGSHYGSAVTVNEVTHLSVTRFEERQVAHIAPLPGRYAYGLHTISRAGDYTLIDGARKEPRR